MSGRRSAAPPFAMLAAALALPAGAWAQAAGAAATTSNTSLPPSWAHVTYISGQNVYLDAGSRDGLREGSKLQVIRADSLVAEIVVQYISSSHASAHGASTEQLVVVGDSARFTPVGTATGVANGSDLLAATVPDAPPPSEVRRSNPNRLRGRFGLRYLMVDPGLGPSATMTQPAFDVRLDGQHLGDSPWGVAVDIRAQRSIMGPRDSTTPAPTSPMSVTRVYKAALVFNLPGRPTSVTVGRQFSQAIPSIGLFDGAAVDLNKPRWSTGVFGGMEPDMITFKTLDSTRQYGAWAQWHNVPAKMPLWALTFGGVGAYAGGQIDREFAYLSAMFTNSRLSFYAAQEVDINRGWKLAQEKSSVTPTSTFATAQLSLIGGLSVYGGLDNRRNIRLYRDYVNPEVTFDDSFREGEWGGLSLAFAQHVRLSADTRISSGGTAGPAKSYTGSLSVFRLTPLQLGMHLRSTMYSGQLSDGRLQSAALEFNPWNLFRFEFTGGTRDTSEPLAFAASTHVTWTSIDADIGLGRWVYLMLSSYRETGIGTHNSQTYASISWRF